MTPLEELLITRMPLEELPGILAMLPALAEDTTRLRLPSVYDKRTYVSSGEYMQMRLEGKGLEELEALRAKNHGAAQRKREHDEKELKKLYENQVYLQMRNAFASGTLGQETMREAYERAMYEKAQYQR